MKKLALLFLLAGSGAGCLPARDNPNDSALRPVARLAVVDTGPGSACPGAPLDEYPTVTDVSRGRCLALDARSSSDPQGASDIEEFEFHLPSGVDGLVPPPVLASNGLLVFAAPYRRSLAANTALQFSVTVRDRDGNEDEETTTVLLRNERPTALLPSGFAVPAGGLPWNGAAPTVTIDASRSADADGDELHYCWSAPGLSECLTGDAGRFYEYTPPTQTGRYVVTLEVRDAEEGGNVLASRPARTVVWVEPLPLWETPTGSFQLVERLDNSSSTPIQANGSGRFLRSGATLGTDLIVTVTSVSPQLRAFSYPDLTPGAPLAVASGGRLFPHAPTNRVWLSRYLGGGTYQFEVYAPRADLGFDDLNGSPVQLALGDAFDSALVALGPAGDLWVGSRVSGSVHSLSGPQTPAQERTIDAIPRDLAARPGRDEMWVLVQDVGTEFRVYSGSSATPEAVVVEGLEAYYFEWIDEREMWIATVDGIRRVDADLLRETALAGFPELALELATSVVVPVISIVGDMVIDPDSGEIWTENARIAPDLSVHESEALPQFIDPAGFPWTNVGGLRRVRSLVSDGTLETIQPLEADDAGSMDVVQGSFWLTGGMDPYYVLEEYTSEGVRRRRHSSLQDENGTVSLLPRYGALAMFPDATGAFASRYNTPDVVHELDLTTQPPVMRTIPTVASDEDLIAFFGFHASASAQPPFVWSAATDATELFPVRLSRDGVQRDTGVTISSQFGYSLFIARSLVDDGACIATLEEVFVSGTTYQLQVRLYRALPGSPAVLLDERVFQYTGSGAGSVNYFLPFVSATRAPNGGEMCWTGHVRTANPPTSTSVDVLTVFGAQQGAGTVRSFTYTGVAGERIRTAAATGPNEVWYLRDFQLSNGTFTSSARVRRHSPNGSGVLSSETVLTSFDHPGQSRSLLFPESQSR